MDEGTDFISITVETRDLPVEFQDLGPLTLAVHRRVLTRLIQEELWSQTDWPQGEGSLAELLAVRLPHNLIGPILDSDDAGH